MKFKNHNNPRYTCVPYSILDDHNLSWDEKGLLCYLLSNQDGCTLAQFVLFGSDTKESVKSYLDNLKSLGYVKEDSEGRFTYGK